MADTPTCYMEFRVTDPARFQVFVRFFDVLKNWTQQRLSGATSTDDTQETRMVSTADETMAKKSVDRVENWMLVLRPIDLEMLGMPNHFESLNALKSWRGLTRRERREIIGRDNRLQILADFEDMLKRFQDVQYTLNACRQISPDRARLEFNVELHPFGGKEALQEMLLFFGFFSILDDNC